MSVLCSASSAGAGGQPQQQVLYVKGAPESVLERCTSALTNEAGSSGGGEGGGAVVLPMTAGLRTALYSKVAEYGAGAALRVLALAYRPWPAGGGGSVRPEDEQQLTFVGLVGLQVCVCV